MVYLKKYFQNLRAWYYSFLILYHYTNEEKNQMSEWVKGMVVYLKFDYYQNYL